MPGRNQRGWRRRTPGRAAPAPPIDAETARLLERIAEIARNVRATWFILLGVLAFAGVTLLGVEDADFFAWGRQTTLPLVGVEIPTRSFFFNAPVLVAALYCYFIFQLRQLWLAMADAEKRRPRRSLEHLAHPGLLAAAGLGFGRPEGERGNALDRLQRVVVLALIWWAGPVVLLLLWWRGMPAHAEWLTLANAASLLLTVFVAWKSFAEARALLGAAGPLRPRRPVWLGLALGLLVLSWARTEGGLDHYADRAIAWWNRELPERAVLFGDETTADWIEEEEEDARLAWIAEQRWIPKARIWRHARFWDHPLRLVSLAPVDLVGVALVPRPDDWRPHDVARDAFGDAWCARKGYDVAACAALDDDQREAFERAWREERTATLQSLPPLVLRRADLRAARLRGAFAPAAVLAEARLQGADLRHARLEGADLWQARLEGADLWQARLEGAVLTKARLEGAVLTKARLEGADFTKAQLEGAVLWQARLEGAVIRDARLEGALLSAADFTGTALKQGQIDGAIGDAETVLPRDAATGAQLYVWSCWEEPPPTLDQTLATFQEYQRHHLRELWLCNGRPREKVGRPAPEP